MREYKEKFMGNDEKLNEETKKQLEDLNKALEAGGIETTTQELEELNKALENAFPNTGAALQIQEVDFDINDDLCDEGKKAYLNRIPFNQIKTSDKDFYQKFRALHHPFQIISERATSQDILPLLNEFNELCKKGFVVGTVNDFQYLRMYGCHPNTHMAYILCELSNEASLIEGKISDFQYCEEVEELK
jgi:hypothetical protein